MEYAKFLSYFLQIPYTAYLLANITKTFLFLTSCTIIVNLHSTPETHKTLIPKKQWDPLTCLLTLFKNVYILYLTIFLAWNKMIGLRSLISYLE